MKKQFVKILSLCALGATTVFVSCDKNNDDEKPEVKSEKRFFAVVRAAFNQRRKTLLNALSSGLNGFTKEQIAQAIADCGLDEKVRGEALGIAEFARLSDLLDTMAKEATA